MAKIALKNRTFSSFWAAVFWGFSQKKDTPSLAKFDLKMPKIVRWVADPYRGHATKRGRKFFKPRSRAAFCSEFKSHSPPQISGVLHERFRSYGGLKFCINVGKKQEMSVVILNLCTCNDHYGGQTNFAGYNCLFVINN